MHHDALHLEISRTNLPSARRSLRALPPPSTTSPYIFLPRTSSFLPRFYARSRVTSAATCVGGCISRTTLNLITIVTRNLSSARRSTAREHRFIPHPCAPSKLCVQTTRLPLPAFPTGRLYFQIVCAARSTAVEGRKMEK